MVLQRGYPRIRLELECGCKEVDTAPGCTNVYECGSFGHAEGHALFKAREALDAHNIVTVENGGGVARLQNGK